MTSDAAPQLSYADLPTRWGITAERTETSLRIITPPLGRTRYLPFGFRLGFGYLLFILSLLSISAALRPRGFDWVVIGNIAMYAVLLSLLMLYAYRKLQVATLLQVDSTFLTISRLLADRAMIIHRWPRAQIGLVKLNRNDGMLLVQVIGVTFYEQRISGDSHATQWVAQELQSALVSLPHEPAGRVVPYDPSAALQRRRVRMVVTITAGLLLVVMGATLFIDYHLFCLGLEIVCLLAAIPAGIVMGTQKKDYYF